MGTVEKLFVTGKGGNPMQSVPAVEALGGGLVGDRYRERTGYWTAVDECQVTLIEAEALDAITEATDLRVQNGEHRRNIVTRGVILRELYHQRFRVGDAVLIFNRPRPPCAYIQKLEGQPGLTKALGRVGGICADVLHPGMIRVGDSIALIDPSETLPAA